MRRFDVIVAGGGSAGCALAARLSENADRTVCLIEAGPSDVDDPNILVLKEWMHLLDSGYDWDYPVEPQERSRLAKVPRHRGRHTLAQPVRRLLAAQLKAQTPRAGLLHSVARHHSGKLRPLGLQRLVEGGGSQD